MILGRLGKRIKREIKLGHLSKYWLLVTVEGWVMIFMLSIILVALRIIVYVLLSM